jgi:hypothetical protein
MRKILLKTTIPFTEDDWHVGRFSLLAAHLESLRDDRGAQAFAVTGRDRATAQGSDDDQDLIDLPDSDFDQLWLFAVDVGDGLSTGDDPAVPGTLRFAVIQGLASCSPLPFSQRSSGNSLKSFRPRARKARKCRSSKVSMSLVRCRSASTTSDASARPARSFGYRASTSFAAATSAASNGSS